MSEPLIIGGGDAQKKPKKWAIGGLTETSSEAESKDGTPPSVESGLNVDSIAKTNSAMVPMGHGSQPNLVNFDNTKSGSENSHRVKVSSEEQEDD